MGAVTEDIGESDRLNTQRDADNIVMLIEQKRGIEAWDIVKRAVCMETRNFLYEVFIDEYRN